MKRILVLSCMFSALGATSIGCSYAGAAASGNSVVVLRNDFFLAGLLRKAYVCKITDAGLDNCQATQSP